MMKSFLLLLFIFLSCQIIAQPYSVWEFRASYGKAPFRNVYSLLKIDDAVIVIAEGYSGDYAPFSPCFIKMDLKGNVISYKDYKSSLYKVKINSVIRSSDSTLTLFGMDPWDANYQVTVSFNGEIVNKKRFENSGSAIRMENGDILTKLWKDTTYIWSYLNADGDTIWSKALFKDNLNKYFENAAKLNDEIVITGLCGTNFSKAFISKISSEGDSVWFKVIDGLTSKINTLVCSSGKIIVAGMIEPVGLNQTRNFISFIDGNGSTKRIKVWGGGEYNAVSYFSILADSSYLLGGELTDSTYHRKAYFGNMNTNLMFNWLYIDPKINNDDYGSPHIYNRGKLCQAVLQLDSSDYIFAGNYHATHTGGLNIESGFISKCSFDVTAVTVKDRKEITYSLEQNYPNPFNPVTIIRYQIPEAGFVSLKVFDMLGKEVASLVNEEKAAGEYTTEFNAFNLSSGVYLYSLQAGGFVQTKKLMLMK